MHARNVLPAVLLGAALFSATPAEAQPDGRFGQTFTVAQTDVDVVSNWQGRRSSVEAVTAGGRRALHRGSPAYAFAAANADGLLVALVGTRAEVEAKFLPVDAAGALGRPRSVVLPRIAGADRAVVGAAVTARPDGFAVFWQEASTSNPNTPYQTFLAQLGPDGRLRGQTRAVPAPWPLADVTWLPEQNRYYFLLFYGNQQTTRLCGVHVDGQSLRPIQHPWWATAGGAIDEARLVRSGNRVVALYRDGATLKEADVTAGGWGQEPPAPRSHGAIRPDQTFAILAEGERLDVRTRALR